jgi:trehalose-phosphatase
MSGGGSTPVGFETETQEFLARARRAPRRSLLLDFDGTLAPFVPDRFRAVPYPGVRELLARVASDERTRLGIVSGRAAEDLRRLLGSGSGFELWASHGLEHVGRAGSYEVPPARSAITRFLEEVRPWIARRGWMTIVEVKPYGLALHERALPDVYAEARPEILDRWKGPACRAGLDIVEFDGGVELRPSGVHKGRVVERILAELPPGAPVAYLGDDGTDEDAFAAIEGKGLGVLVRAERRPTRARAFLRPPEELLRFLEVWVEPPDSEAAEPDCFPPGERR